MCGGWFCVGVGLVGLYIGLVDLYIRRLKLGSQIRFKFKFKFKFKFVVINSPENSSPLNTLLFPWSNTSGEYLMKQCSIHTPWDTINTTFSLFDLSLG